jgi:hypothetical protein
MPSSNAWVNNRLYGYTYNEQGNLTDRFYKKWNVSTGQLITPSYWYTYSYDSNNLATEMTFKTWSTTGNDWLNQSKTFNYYSLHPYFSVPGIDPAGVTIFPNPVGSTLYFNALPEKATVAIYDIQGRMVVSGRITSSRLDVSKLKSGIYTLKISTSAGLISKMFVKQ